MQRTNSQFTVFWFVVYCAFCYRYNNKESLDDSFYKDNAADDNKFAFLPNIDILDNNLDIVSEKLELTEDEQRLVKSLLLLNKE